MITIKVVKYRTIILITIMVIDLLVNAFNGSRIAIRYRKLSTPYRHRPHRL
jgi:hypothetical protein